MCFYKSIHIINVIYSKLHNLKKYSSEAEYYIYKIYIIFKYLSINVVKLLMITSCNPYKSTKYI